MEGGGPARAGDGGGVLAAAQRVTRRPGREDSGTSRPRGGGRAGGGRARWGTDRCARERTAGPRELGPGLGPPPGSRQGRPQRRRTGDAARRWPRRPGPTWSRASSAADWPAKPAIPPRLLAHFRFRSETSARGPPGVGGAETRGSEERRHRPRCLGDGVVRRERGWGFRRPRCHSSQRGRRGEWDPWSCSASSQETAWGLQATSQPQFTSGTSSRDSEARQPSPATPPISLPGENIQAAEHDGRKTALKTVAFIVTNQLSTSS